MIKFKTFLLFIVSILLIINLSKDILKINRAHERITNTEKKLAELKKENEVLKKKKEYYQSDQFLEEEIRNKLQMAKPNEAIVILPEEIANETISSSEINNQSSESSQLANWQKWLMLFK